MSEERKIGSDIVAVVLLTLIVFLIAALATHDSADPLASPMLHDGGLLGTVYQPDQLVYPLNESPRNACGLVGAWLSDMLIHVLGVGAYYLVVGLIALEIAIFRRRRISAPWLRTFGWMLSLIGISALGTTLLPDWTVSPIIGAGGYLGALVHGMLTMHFGLAGGLLIALSLSLVGLMMWTEYLVFRTGRLMFAPAAVATAKVLPFGLVHGFMRWFNKPGRASADEGEEELDEDDDESDLPRTIRIRNRHGKAEVEEDDEAWEEEDPDQCEDEYESDDDDQPATIPMTANGDHEEQSSDEESDDESESLVAAASTVAQKPHFTVPSVKPEPPKSERDEVIRKLNQAALADSINDYELPALDLLRRGDPIPFKDQERDALTKADILEKTCMEFGYNVKVVEVETGPVISQYEIQLEAGLRLNKITALADDLAIALRVTSVRIVAPIPGKNTVGIEVPNETRQIVRLREVIEQSETKTKRMSVPLFLGNDAIGAPMAVDLAKMPHLLIAGRTGTGKSVCLNAIICSILMTRRPDEVRMLMIDPKMVELSGYGRLPHLMHPVVTDMKKAEAILAWAVEKMEERYRLLAKAGVRHINSYNQLGEEELLERLQPDDDEEKREIPVHMPFIVILADEMADLMMTAGRDVETHIIRLAQKSRAVGIHLVLATQKPTVDVITGLIKSNLPARLAFQVASKTDSRVVLDDNGADKLLGSGDMLFLWPGTSTLLRGQGTYLDDDEIDAITDAVSTGEQNFVHELVNMKVDKDQDGDEGEKLKKRDELYAQAVDVVVGEQRGSVSLLQRVLGVGYGRAARLIDYMEEDGFVGPYNGSKSREVLLTSQRWAAIQAGGDDPQDTSDEPEAPLQRIEFNRRSLVAANAAAPTADDEFEFDVDSDDREDDPCESSDLDDADDADDEYDEQDDEEACAQASDDGVEYDDEDEEDDEYEEDDDDNYEQDEDEQDEDEGDEDEYGSEPR